MDAPPAYHEAVKGRQTMHIDEKSKAKPSKSSRLSTLKSILTGDVQKHNPYANLERSLEPRLYDGNNSRKSSKSSKSTASSSSQSTAKSILTGDVWKHHPLLSMERQLNAQMKMEM